MRCDGYSEPDEMAVYTSRIAEFGYTTIGVTDSGAVGEGGWVYTMGLLDTAGHAELVVAGLEISAGYELLQIVAGLVLDGERFAPGDVIGAGAATARIGAVDPIQMDLDTFAMWHRMRELGHLHAPRLEVLQVFAPMTWFCDAHAHANSQPDLSDPRARVDAAPPNRAARRARGRVGHRHRHPRSR